MPRFLSGGRYPVVFRDGRAVHEATGQIIYLCEVCPFGTAHAMFLSREDLEVHHVSTHQEATSQESKVLMPRPGVPGTGGPSPLPEDWEEPADPDALELPDPAPVVRTCRLCHAAVTAATVGDALRLLREHHRVLHRKPLERLTTALLGEEKP